MDYERAAKRLQVALERAQEHVLAETRPAVSAVLSRHLDALFEPKTTQAFREALVGCVLARLDDPRIDARSPSTKHGEHSYSGRMLDERVVNPVLIEWRVPVSKAPFLSSLRRSVRFTEEMRKGIRDQKTFTAFLAVVTLINRAEPEGLDDVLVCSCSSLPGLARSNRCQFVASPPNQP